MVMQRTTWIGMLAVLAVGLMVVPARAAAPQDWQDLLGGLLGGDATTSRNALGNSEIVAGLKEALANGTTHAIENLGRKGGFSGNSLVRIPLPSALQDVGELARQLGQGDKVDAFQLSLNRAAEKAVPAVADIFGEAIRQMTLKDARAILGGGEHAATEYFRKVASDDLATRIQPIVSKATDSVGVTQRYKSLTGSLGSSGLGGVLGLLGVKSDESSLNLDNYVTDKAIDGLFVEIAAQEEAIRENPAARTTELLKKVFGAR